MASFDVVNYSLRPSKSIQRQLVFDGAARLLGNLKSNQSVYVGFGSVWFTDFVLAHKLLGIDDMVSIEANEIGYRRAKFNAPYVTVQVKNGFSSQELPKLLDDEKLNRRPWMVWLDYDFEFNENVKDDIGLLIEKAPTNSIVLTTFNGHEMKYGAAPDRPAHLRTLFGSSVPDDLPKRGELSG